MRYSAAGLSKYTINFIKSASVARECREDASKNSSRGADVAGKMVFYF